MTMCSQYCLMQGDDCSAFRHNAAGGKCEVGGLADDALLDPEHGVEIYVKPENATICMT